MLVMLKCHTPDKFDQFLEDNFLTGRAISMTLFMKITVTIVLIVVGFFVVVVVNIEQLISPVCRTC
jgi:cell division protein FtsX